MTDYSQLVKRLREWGETPYDGDPMIDALLSDVPAAADAIDALQARVAELEAGLSAAADDLRAAGQNMRGCCPGSYINAALLASTAARALFERKQS